ncbi:MAG TPA: peptidase MA family metallohydrolase [Ktedonobacteraceae bacterium]|nr:peptidase MA family metallohydrolase [Ktedonobacteraceae bacterium]
MYSRRSYLLRMLLLCMYVCIFTVVFGSQRTFAADSPITITRQTVKADFPKALDFQMTAHDDSSTITEAQLHLSYNTDAPDETHVVNAATAGATVTFHWHEDAAQNHFTPVGTIVSYSWLIHDTAGQEYNEPTQKFQVTDTRFNWQHLTQGAVQVNWYKRPTSFGQMLLTQVMASLKHITSALNERVQQPITVWVYETTDDFHGSLPPDTHEWTGGIAFPSLRQTSIVIEDNTSDRLRRDLPHELTHLVFHEGLTASIVPTWFDEGLAVYNQSYHELEMVQSFQDALDKHALLRLSTISTDFPQDADQALLAYAQSWKLVDYMYTTFGQQGMAALLQSMHRSSATFELDVENTLHTTVPLIENQWHLSLKQPATLSPDQLTPTTQPITDPFAGISTTDPNAPALIALGVLLIILPLLGFSGLLVRQRRIAEQVRIDLTAQHILAEVFAERDHDARNLPPRYPPPGQAPPDPPWRYPQE